MENRIKPVKATNTKKEDNDENPPNVIDEIKTKGYDVTVVNVFHFKLRYSTLKDRLINPYFTTTDVV